MKLIHCADLHLDSKLQAHLDRETAMRRRNELLRNFARLAEYAEENEVEALLIAGDLFDRDYVSALTRNTVLSVIETHPRIRFYYLRGNHDLGDCLGSACGRLRNLFLFGSRWKTYAEGDGGTVAIAGIELTRENSADAHAALRLDPERFNIVLLHGQTGGTGGSSGRAGTISLRALRGRGIDYLALGHLHTRQEAVLDSRGICCYPGCLEGRGFDECGPHGFFLLDVDEKRRAMTHRFVPFAQRTLYSFRTDVTGCRTTAQMIEAVRRTLRSSGCTAGDMADVTLCGEIDVDCEMDLRYLHESLEAHLYFSRVNDATTLRIDPEEYLHEESLRGEFVRLVLAEPSIPESEKTAVIRCGFRAMDGEDPV